MMLKDRKAVIFDLDGTIADSMTVWADIDMEFFSRRNIPVPVTLQHDIEGMSFTETAQYFVNTFALPESVEELKNLWTKMAMDRYRHYVKPKPGIKEFLVYLKEHSIPTGIATSNSRELLNAFLEENRLDTYIDAAVTSCDVSAGKPSPDVYLKTAGLLGVSPRDCLVFEDVPMGILAGKNADMKVCAVEDAYSAQQREKKRELADYYIRDYYDVLDSRYEVLI